MVMEAPSCSDWDWGFCFPPRLFMPRRPYIMLRLIRPTPPAVTTGIIMEDQRFLPAFGWGDTGSLDGILIPEAGKGDGFPAIGEAIKGYSQ